MVAGPYDLYIEQGATFRRVMHLTSAGDPTDLTGFDVRAQIRAKVSSPEILHQIDVTITDDVGGEVTMLITDEDSDSFEWRKGVWDLELANPNGDVQRLLKGIVTVDPQVTR